MKINHFYAADDFTGEQCVLLSDHMASHAYDEAKERELFESEFSYFPEGIWFSKLKGMYLSVNGRIYEQGQASEMNNQWAGWKACAKSRARSAE